ncbi:MAG TPA: glycosyl hydrolase 115 family protein [Lacunisphaera sp.]|nr:glycosyl hydrolase 115 family protein [Lacunisphaera sp.]
MQSHRHAAGCGGSGWNPHSGRAEPARNAGSTFLAVAALLALAGQALAFEVSASPDRGTNSVILSDGKAVATIVVDAGDFPVVSLAANLLADDVARVAGTRPNVAHAAPSSGVAIVAGTLGHSSLVDQLAAAGKLAGLDRIKGRWEATLTQTVADPFPGVDRAFVIVGSDRRGTAYGLTQLSEKIGVSPWSWWADVPAAHQPSLAVVAPEPESDAPAVQYRGIFINDEDWGLNPWAAKTFDPEFGNIGPKTYAKVFELMLRLRLNYLWPAMHACSKEFALTPENAALADRYGIVAGSSHCEPMLCNNIHWDEARQGKWNYSLNRDTIHAYWEESAVTRGDKEAVWTLGIRGIHDRGMESPPTAVPERIKLVEQVIQDQRALLAQHVTNQWGPIAQCFVPYKEVLPLYDAGLAVPDDVTIVWVDDNFGYIRRLGAPAERARAGGAGVYWHLSYYGGPHSYTWINTTPPALMWEELHKAWDNHARRLWVINVGDIKPMEIGISYFARLAWNPAALGPDSQPAFLRSFAAEQFGPAVADPAAELLTEYYRLGTIRKPELMDRAWALSLPKHEAADLAFAYAQLLAREESLAAQVPAAARDAWFELVGFPARVLSATGSIFLADRRLQTGIHVTSHEAAIARSRGFLQAQVDRFNDDTAGGKWKHMMPGLETAHDLTKWNSQVRWPWGEKPGTAAAATPAADRAWRDAASADRNWRDKAIGWTPIAGLGASGRALALLPASLDSSWKESDASAPALEFDFERGAGTTGEVLVDFLPTFRIYPGMKLRVGVGFDDQPVAVVEVPGSSGREDENGTIRSDGIQNNFVRATVPLPALPPGRHILKLRAIDPGAVIDRISIP